MMATLLAFDEGPERAPVTWMMSLRAPFAGWSLNGLKTHEIRRRGCTLQPEDRVLVYETRPVAAVVGELVVKEVLVLPVGRLMQPEWLDRHRLRPAEVTDYAAGLPRLTVIEWADGGERYTRPVQLAELAQIGVQPVPGWLRASGALEAVADARRAEAEAARAVEARAVELMAAKGTRTYRCPTCERFAGTLTPRGFFPSDGATIASDGRRLREPARLFCRPRCVPPAWRVVPLLGRWVAGASPDVVAAAEGAL